MRWVVTVDPGTSYTRQKRVLLFIGTILSLWLTAGIVSAASCPAEYECLTPAQAKMKWPGGFTQFSSDHCTPGLAVMVPDMYCYQAVSASTTTPTPVPKIVTPIIIPKPVIKNTLPVARIATRNSGSDNAVPLTIKFDGQKSYDPDENDRIATYTWTFGDGTTTDGSAVTHTFINPGKYAVSLTITDSWGAAGSTSVTIQADPPHKNLPRPGPSEVSVIPRSQTGASQFQNPNLNSQDPDIDGDGIPNEQDNCPYNWNPDQKNTDKTGLDPDGYLVGDSFGDACDNCPFTPNQDQKDSDISCSMKNKIPNCYNHPDGVGDACDNCPSVYNINQENADGDKFGDACDTCQYYNDFITDTNGNGIDDACDDSDGDGIMDTIDNCRLIANSNQADRDGDTVGDVCDNCPTYQNQVIYDTMCPDFNQACQLDYDHDGIGDTCDCDDQRRGPNEVGIDCGGPRCTPCGYIKIKGRILYEDAPSYDASTGSSTPNNFTPVRNARFRIEACKDEKCNQIAWRKVVATDSKGYFSLNTTRLGVEKIYLLLGSRDGDNEITFYQPHDAVRLTKNLDGCNQYVFWVTQYLPVPLTGDLNLGDLKIGVTKDMDFVGYWHEEGDGWCDGTDHLYPGGAAYFNILDVIEAANDYAKSKRDDTDSIGYVNIDFPKYMSGQSETSFWWNEIHYKYDAGFSDYTIAHEYAHHLQKTIGRSDTYIGLSSQHDFCSDKGDTEFAWSEGFAEYFGTIIVHNPRQPLMNNFTISHLEDGKNIESPCAGSYGNTKESTVAAVLWDAVDEYGSKFPKSDDEEFDTLSGKQNVIFKIFDNEMDFWYSDAPDICDFRKAWMDRSEISQQDKDAMKKILEHYKVRC